LSDICRAGAACDARCDAVDRSDETVMLLAVASTTTSSGRADVCVYS
jgi:hypothetical protein